VALAGLAMMLVACGGPASSSEPAAATPTVSAISTPSETAETSPAETADFAAMSVRSQFSRFASADDSTIDEAGAKICAAGRAGTLDALISASEATLHMSPAETVDFTRVVVNAYCSEVPLPAAMPASSVPPASATTTITPGTWLVGRDIQPATYETTTSDTDVLHSCYWARLSGTSGDSSEILANGNVEGHGIVTIKPTDQAFQTHCTWTKIG
jgi:hypothetical protein